MDTTQRKSILYILKIFVLLSIALSSMLWILFGAMAGTSGAISGIVVGILISFLFCFLDRNNLKDVPTISREQKTIANYKIPPLFYRKNNFVAPSIISFLGAVVALIFMSKMVVAEHSKSVTFTTDDWIGLTAACFIFFGFLPISIILYVSNLLIHIIESIEQNRNDKSKVN